jgi:hypothetical protein
MKGDPAILDKGQQLIGIALELSDGAEQVVA